MSIVARFTKARPILTALTLLALVLCGGCIHKKYENPITKDTQQPDKVLFDKAIKDIEHGRYEVARLTLNTLTVSYTHLDVYKRQRSARPARRGSNGKRISSHGVRSPVGVPASSRAVHSRNR